MRRSAAPLKHLMRGTFGLDQFRPRQEAVIHSIVEGRDPVAIMPTGAPDEAHCVSQWGHDFRPAFLALPSAVKALGRPPDVAARD